MIIHLNQSIALLLILDVETNIRRICYHSLSVILVLLLSVHLMRLHLAETSAHLESFGLPVEVLAY